MTPKQLSFRKWYLKNRDQQRERYRLYREKNKEKFTAYEKERYAHNPEFFRQKNRTYSRNNRSKVNSYIKKRYATDPEYRIKCLLRSRLYKITKLGRKNLSALEALGCSIEFLKQHIESKFSPGMTWDNWKYDGWHLDHIIPLCTFDLTDESEYKKAFHYLNLQPLWRKENQSKLKWNHEKA